MKAMILAAGRGLRLRPLTDKTPKPLIRVLGKPLIVYQVVKLAKIGIQHIVINVSYKAKRIMETLGNGNAFGVTIYYSFELAPLETGGGITKALPILGPDPFMVISADIWTDFPLERLLNYRLKKNFLAHLILVDNPSFHPSGDFTLTNKGLLSKDKGEKLTFSSLGVYHPDLFKDKVGAFSLSSLLCEFIAKKKITGEYYKGLWFNTGTPQELERLNNYLEQKKGNIL